MDHFNEAAVTAKPAKLYNVTIAVNNEGSIVGGGAMDMDVAVYVNGDPCLGKPSTRPSSLGLQGLIVYMRPGITSPVCP